MDHNDTISKQIRQAAENAEQAPFPGMDKVWSRVEDKLDHKVLSSQKKYWKQLAVAASVLLVGSVAYQFLKEAPQQKQPQQNSIVVADTIATPDVAPAKEETIVEAAPANSAIKPEAATILQQHLNQPVDSLPAVAANEVEAVKEEAREGTKEKEDHNNYRFQKPTARSVSAPVPSMGYFEAEKQDDEMAKKQVSKKADPLIVLNGNAVTGKSERESKRNSARAMETLREEADSIVVLPDPLYIINGRQYREEELFGPNPTSPYYPLNRQDILSISILKDEKAAPYGEKGKKGVVIITTRDGKPATQEKSKK